MDEDRKEMEEKDRYVTVNKRNIIHKFVVTGHAWVDSFCAEAFYNWENETFDIFEIVKNPEGIAIDLGSWLGTTAIWLSKHFAHVVAVEADKKSVCFLRKNLHASECYNVSVCDKAIAHIEQPVVFGPRGSGELNGSISTIKRILECENDYIVDSINITRIFDEYVKNIPSLKNREVSFIKCDIEGGEEGIIEDLLQCAYSYNCKVFVSFHLSWWSFKKIGDFRDLFTHFTTNCPMEDVCSYLEQNPFASLLFSKKDGAVHPLI